MPKVNPVEPVLAIAREHLGKIPMAVATGGQRGRENRGVRAVCVSRRDADACSARIQSSQGTGRFDRFGSAEPGGLEVDGEVD